MNDTVNEKYRGSIGHYLSPQREYPTIIQLYWAGLLFFFNKNTCRTGLSSLLHNNSLRALHDSTKYLLLSYSFSRSWNSKFVSLIVSDPGKLHRWIQSTGTIFLKAHDTENGHTSDFMQDFSCFILKFQNRKFLLTLFYFMEKSSISKQEVICHLALKYSL